MDKTIRAYTPKDIENSTISSNIEAVKSKYPIQTEAIETLISNIPLNENTILYGKGGYGKSLIAVEVCKALELSPVVMICHAHMTVDDFLGPINLKTLYHESAYEHNFEKTAFMTPGVLILEEFSDLNPTVATTLKDIIQSKGYRYKDKMQHHAIQAIVAIGNIAPKELALDASTQALYNDRFISHIDMTWKSHAAQHYMQLFTIEYKVVSNELTFLAQLCAKNKLSPRTALSAAKKLVYGGIKMLKHMHVFDKEELHRLELEYHDSI